MKKILDFFSSLLHPLTDVIVLSRKERPNFNGHGSKVKNEMYQTAGLE